MYDFTNAYGISSTTYNAIANDSDQSARIVSVRPLQPVDRYGKHK